METSIAKTVALFGCSVEQAQKQCEKNLAQLREMHAKAVKTGKPVNNFTAQELAASIERLSK